MDSDVFRRRLRLRRVRDVDGVRARRETERDTLGETTDGTRSERAGDLTFLGDHRREMTDPAEAISLLVVVEFVVMAAILLLLVPFEVAAPVVPLLLFFVVVLHLYRS